MQSLESRARDFAIQVHEAINHKRKYNDEPYHYHMSRVTNILRQYTNDEHALAASWLHDSVEDVGVPIFKIKELFGNKVACLVLEMTNLDHVLDYKHLNRAERKAINKQQWAESSADAQNIKFCDFIDNTKDIVKDDRQFASIYIAEIQDLLTVMTKGNSELRTKLFIQLQCLELELQNK